jgi:hypothetical protein
MVHVERGRIGGADPFKSYLAAPEFHAALGVRVEDPHVPPHPKGHGLKPAFSQGYLVTSGVDKGRGMEESECD